VDFRVGKDALAFVPVPFGQELGVLIAAQPNFRHPAALAAVPPIHAAQNVIVVAS